VRFAMKVQSASSATTRTPANGTPRARPWLAIAITPKTTTAIITTRGVILTRPGAASRAGEVAVIRPALPERGADYQSNVALYPNSRTTFAHGGHRFLRCGARMIPFFCLLARKPSSATTRKRKFICSMPAILRWRVVALRSYTPGEGPVFRRIDTTL